MIINTRNKKFWRNWHLRTQLCMIQFILTTTTMILLLLTTYIFQNYITDIFMSTSEYIFTKQFGKWTKNMMYYHAKGVEQTIYRSQQQLYRTNKIYSLIEQMNSPQITQPFSCLDNLDEIDQFSYSASFCYEIYNTTSSGTKLQNLKNICSIFTSVLYMMDQDFDVMFASSGDIHFFSVWPGSFLNKSYDPQKRTWYTTYMDNVAESRNSSLISFSPPHIHWTWNILMVAQTTSLLNQNGNIDGVIASHVNFSMFQKLSEIEQSISFSIINEEGQILLSQLNITESSHIYDESLTGLDEDDYNQIIAQKNNQTVQNDCQKNIWEAEGYLCRKSRNSTEEELISTFKIEGADLILVLQSKLSAYQKQMSDMFDYFSDQLSHLIFGALIGSIAYMFAQIIVSSLFIIILFNPLIQIINYTSQHIFKESLLMQHHLKKKQKYHFVQPQSNLSQMDQLQASFNKLIHFSEISKKSCQCSIIEKFKYPIKRWNLQKRIKKIKKNCKKIITNYPYKMKLLKLRELIIKHI